LAPKSSARGERGWRTERLNEWIPEQMQPGTIFVLKMPASRREGGSYWACSPVRLRHSGPHHAQQLAAAPVSALPTSFVSSSSTTAHRIRKPADLEPCHPGRHTSVALQPAENHSGVPLIYPQGDNKLDRSSFCRACPSRPRSIVLRSQSTVKGSHDGQEAIRPVVRARDRVLADSGGSAQERFTRMRTKAAGRERC